MSSPTRPIPNEQVRRFGLAVCERLGLDPELVSDKIDWQVMGGDEHGKIELTVVLPAEEILAMFNGSADVIAP